MKNKELTDVLLDLAESYKQYVKTEAQHFITFNAVEGLNILLLEYDEESERQVGERSIGEIFSPHDFGYASIDKFKEEVVDILKDEGLKYLGHFDR